MTCVTQGHYNEMKRLKYQNEQYINTELGKRGTLSSPKRNNERKKIAALATFGYMGEVGVQCFN